MRCMCSGDFASVASVMVWWALRGQVMQVMREIMGTYTYLEVSMVIPEQMCLNIYQSRIHMLAVNTRSKN